MTGRYSKAKTVVKGAEAPFIVTGVAVLIKKAAEHAGIPFGGDDSLVAALLLYGAWKGLMNWIKNRRRR